MTQGATTTRIALLNEDGDIIGDSIALEVSSESLQESLDAMTEALMDLKQVILMTFG